MNSIKIIFFLSTFGVLVYSSDDDSGDQFQSNNDRVSPFVQSNSDRVSPLGLYMISRIPLCVERYDKEITQLEKKLSDKKLTRIAPIRLSEALLLEALEEMTDEVDHSKDVISGQVIDVGYTKLRPESDEDTEQFQQLLRKISSMRTSLNNCPNEENEPCSVQTKVDSLLLRLVGIGREHCLSIDSSLHNHLLLDHDQGIDSTEKLKNEHFISVLDQEKNSEEQSASLDLERTGSIQRGSITLTIPRALSFKHIQNQALKVSARATSDNKSDSKFQHEIFGKKASDGSDDSTDDEDYKEL